MTYKWQIIYIRRLFSIWKQKKKKHFHDLIMLLSILGQVRPILCQILKRSMVVKWHQPEFMAGNGNKSGTEKKIPSLWSDYAIINCGSISPILVKF